MEGKQVKNIPSVEEILLHYIVGSVWAGLKERYELVLGGVAAWELVCLLHSLWHPELFAAAMGLQNAMSTS